MKVEILFPKWKLTKNIRELTRNRFTPIKFIAPESIERACKERGIRLSGSPLGRPPAQVSLQAKKQAQEDERIRNENKGNWTGQKKVQS